MLDDCYWCFFLFVASSEGRPVIIDAVTETSGEETVPAVFDKLTADQLNANGMCIVYCNDCYDIL